MHVAKFAVRAEYRPIYGELRSEIGRSNHMPILDSDGITHNDEFFQPRPRVTDEDETMAAIEQIRRARTTNTKVEALRRYAVGRVQDRHEHILLDIAHEGADEGRLLVVGTELA
jgi:hypothetical protein